MFRRKKLGISIAILWHLWYNIDTEKYGKIGNDHRFIMRYKDYGKKK